LKDRKRIELKKIILHVGVSKTATTSMQKVFYRAYKEGMIEYLGKAKLYDTERMFYPFYKERQSIQYASDIEFNKVKYKIKEKFNSYIEKSDKEIILLSDETFGDTIVSYQKEKDLYRSIRRLHFIFNEHDVSVLLVIRNQVDAIYSLYVEAYAYYEEFPQTDTFARFLESSLRQKKDGNLSAYYYDDVICEYERLFLKDNINIIFYEDLVGDPEGFIYTVADIINVDGKRLYKLMCHKKENVKNKKASGYVVRDQVVVRRYLAKTWYKALGYSGFYNFISMINDSLLYRLIAKKIIGQVLRHKKKINDFVISYPSFDERNRIENEYQSTNRKISSWTGVNLKEKGYPV